MDSALFGGNTLSNIALIVLIAVAVWAVVELALTLRKARQSVDELTRSASETIDQVQPIIAKLDETIDGLQPTVGDIQPLVEKVELTIDEANVSLAKVNGILGDVSELSGAASSVTSSVTSSVKSAAAAATSGVQGIVDRVVGTSHAAPTPALSEPADDPARLAPAQPDEPVAAATSGYITYGEDRVEAEDMTAARTNMDPDTTSELPVITRSAAGAGADVRQGASDTDASSSERG